MLAGITLEVTPWISIEILPVNPPTNLQEVSQIIPSGIPTRIFPRTRNGFYQKFLKQSQQELLNNSQVVFQQELLEKIKEAFLEEAFQRAFSKNYGLIKA